MMNLKEMFQLSDRGAKDLKKGIFACTLTNLSLMLSVVVTVQIFLEVLKPLTGGAVSWSKMWLLFGAGVVAVIVHFLCCKNDYRKTYVSCYTAAEDSRIRIAELVRKFPMSVFNNKDLTELTTNMMGDCASIEHSMSHIVPPLMANAISCTLICICVMFFDWRNLDIQAIEKVRKILSLLKQQGKTIIIAEHRTYYLKELVDRAIYMENGRIVREYSMEELGHLSRAEQLHTGIRTVDLLSYPVVPHTAASASHKITLKDVHCSYDKTEALSIPELSLASGRITAIIGTNGAGKSTFVSWLCGLMKKSKGAFLLDGKIQRTKDRVQKSYLVMQEVNYQLFSDSVREEIVLGSSRSTEDSLQEIMASLDISELAERHPMTLSGGQKQRVIIASAMFCGKKILCFDEPTSGLDFSHMMQTCELLKKLQGDDTFLFIITHDYELIASTCDSVVHIEHGHFLEQYTLDLAGIQKLKSFFTQYMEDVP